VRHVLIIVKATLITSNLKEQCHFRFSLIHIIYYVLVTIFLATNLVSLFLFSKALATEPKVTLPLSDNLPLD